MARTSTKKPTKKSNSSGGGGKKSTPTSKEERDQRKNMFQRLFAQESIDTDVSGDEDDGSHRTGAYSLDSATYYGTDDSDSDSDDDTDEPSATSTLLKFDRDLRARHRGACKNMTNGKYAKAIKTFEGILSDLLERFGEEHYRVGAALHNVAVANLRAGLLDDAKDAIEEAVRIRKLTLGDDHPKVAVSSTYSRSMCDPSNEGPRDMLIVLPNLLNISYPSYKTLGLFG
jgi:Tetratricopeptide repeat